MQGMTPRRARACAGLGTLCVGLLFLLVSYTSLGWVGTTFPGFLLMANRVVPSVSLPNWEGAPKLFQSEILSIDGVPVTSSSQVYEAVSARPPGTTFLYELRDSDGGPANIHVASRVFSWSDLALVQGGMAINGLTFAAIGFFVLYLRPGRATTYGVLSATLSSGLFAITAADLYGPHWFFRFHVLAETFVAPAFVHLALVFPTDRVRHRRWPVLLTLYLPFVGLAAYYERALFDPSAYTQAHLTATSLHGVAVVVVLVRMGRALRTASPLVRRRIGIVGLGIVSGVGIPLALMAGSAILGGRVPVNAGVLAGFLFPLSLAYAILQRDLFEIDKMLRRGISYVTVLAAVTSIYFVSLFLIGQLMPRRDLWTQAPATIAVLNLTVLLLFAPIRDRVQNAVDRLFFRKGYDAEDVLAQLSQLLASARAMEGVAAHVLAVIRGALGPLHAAVALHEQEARFRCIAGDSSMPPYIEIPSELTRRMQQGFVIARYEWEDGSGLPIPEFWQQLDAELIVPIRSGNEWIGIIVLGPRASGRAYTINDVALLQTIANQVVLAMTTATAFGKLEQMNEGLERQVRERTLALEDANGELNRSLQELQRAYELLERNQASLVRADRLATLGRLVAGMAHEINTPLAAVQNSLQVVLDLSEEYATSIDDPNVLPQDHHQIAEEIRTTAGSAATWARKAAGYLSRTKLHGRELVPGIKERFAVKAVVEETHQLLAHRVRATSCVIDYEESPDEITLVGDQQRLGQVLVNLVSNAIDAYEDNGIVDGKIEIRALRQNGSVVVHIRDWAGGIPAAALPHVFDELFTTKEPGKGTGLGLWIARNLVEESFGGRLAVQVEPGVGSCFTATFAEPKGDIANAFPGEATGVTGQSAESALLLASQ